MASVATAACRSLRLSRSAAVPRGEVHRLFSSTAAVRPEMTILDGGMGHELRASGIEIEGPIGSQRRFLGVTLATVERPEVVRGAHARFLASGAGVVTTNNYAMVPATLALTGEGATYKDRDLEFLVGEAGKRAREAVAAAGGSARVAGSLPPLRESYCSDCVPTYVGDTIPTYKRIVKALAPHVDLLVCETMSCAREGLAAAMAATDEGGGLPVWVAYTLKEDCSGRLRSGETVEEAIDALLVAGLHGRIAAVLFNCCHVDSVTAALPRAQQAVKRLAGSDGVAVQVGAYPNRFRTCKSDGKCSDYDEGLSPSSFADIAQRWSDMGATIIGGCCGIGPDYIDALHKRLH